MGPHDHDGRDDDPRDPPLPAGDRGGGAWHRDDIGPERMRPHQWAADREASIGCRRPHAEEAERHDERGQGREHVRQGVVEVVRGDELRRGEAAARHEQHRPEGANGSQAAVDGHDVEGQQQRHEGQLPADHGAERHRREAGHLPQYRDGCPERPERHGCRVEDERIRQGFERRVAHEDQEGARDGDRRTKTRYALEQAAEAEADHHEDDATIVRHMVDDPVAEGVEAARDDRDIVEQQRVEDDPHHRPEREHHAGRDGVDGETGRELPDGNRDDQGRHESAERGLPRRAAQDAEQHQHGGDRYRCHQKRQCEASADRRQQLIEHDVPPNRFLMLPTGRFLRPCSIYGPVAC